MPRSHNLSVVLGEFDFEKDRCVLGGARSFERFWPLGFPACALYVILVFLGQRWMRYRKPLDLRMPLIVWNAFLALFSAIGTFRTLPNILGEWFNHSFYFANCNSIFQDVNCANCDSLIFWALLFGWSKLLELGDTAFLVLRKRPVIFLHWYHHITVLLYTWYSFGLDVSACKWFIVMNYFVHAFMYTYFTLQALRIRLPKWVPVGVTLLQITQMMLGCLIVLATSYYHLTAPLGCNTSNVHTFWSLALYGSYWFLFCHFFYKRYVAHVARRNSRTAAKTPVSRLTSAKGG